MSLSTLTAAVARRLRRRPRVRHIHASGRYTRSPKSLLAALRAYAARADIITLTEVDREARAAVFAHVKGFDHYRGHGFPAADESAVLWRTDVYDMVMSGCRELAAETGSQRKSIAGEAVVLRHRATGQYLLVTVCHTPADVEGDWHAARPTTKVTAHHTTIGEWIDWRDDLIERWRPDGIIMAADWNLDLHKEWVRRWLTDVFPHHGGLHTTWAGRMPTWGTLGHRLIDWAMTNMRVLDAKVLKRNPSSDHCAFLQILALPKPKPRR